MADKNSRTGLSLEEMTALIKAVSESNIDSFDYKEGEFSITLHTGRSGILTSAANAAGAGAFTGVSMAELNKAMSLAADATSGVPDEEDDDDTFVIKSPLVGTFYAAPAADAKPFVKIGDRVKKGQVLAIVEAMKMMNEIESDCDGVISEILVTNGSPVEYGQPLFRIS
jgi:acetyl-CoA carboxylase biotin carboxyl carrier protein